MRRVFLAVILSLLVSVGFAQGPSYCTAPVSDLASVLSASSVQQLTAATTSLANEGADPRVITYKTSETPEMFISNATRDCAQWRNPSNGVKSNMVVFIVNPVMRKMGIFSGSAYNGTVLASAPATDIKKNFMGPKFRDADWAGGFLAGIQQTTQRVHVYVATSGRPSQTVINKQATDMSGLWFLLKILTFLLFGILLVIVGVKFFKFRSEREEARLVAVDIRDSVVKLAQKLNSKLDEMQALGQPISTPNKSDLENILERYTRASNSMNLDPDTSGLSIAEYKSIGTFYSNLLDDLKSINLEPAPLGARVSKKGKATRKQSTASNLHKKFDEVEATPTSTNTTTIIHEEHLPDYYNTTPAVVPVFVPIPVGESRPRYHDDDDDYRRRSINTNDSDDSSKSDDYGSSSSSSFDNGSSDWGSSSSSDFGGGGSDFGGGGGGDF